MDKLRALQLSPIMVFDMITCREGVNDQPVLLGTLGTTFQAVRIRQSSDSLAMIETGIIQALERK